jgi:hypothetical protein
MSKAQDYRDRAAECQREAGAAKSENVRASLLDIAEKYLSLAANEDWSTAMLGAATNG